MKKTPRPSKRTPKRAPRRTRPPRSSRTRDHRQAATHRPDELSRMINRILVPIDFSSHSKNALKYAIPMAEQFGATLHLIYVVEPTIYPADLGFGQVVMPGVEDELREKGAEELKSLIAEEIGARVKATSAVRTGKPHQEILQEAAEQKIDLIVIATHGHSGVEHILFGSTAARIMRLAKCPVLIVRPQTTE